MSFADFSGTEAYLHKLVPQHRQRIKFSGVVKAILDKTDGAYSVLEDIDADFMLNTATGNQLDALGELVGASRMLNFEPLYAKPLLDDENYRKLIKAHLSLNQWDGTMKGLLDLWEAIFSNYSIQVLDNQDMTITLILGEGKDLFEQELINRGYFVPKPEGVLIHYYFIEMIEDSGEIFGAQGINNYFSLQALHSKQFQLTDSKGDIHIGGKQTGSYTFQALASAGFHISDSKSKIYSKGKQTTNYSFTELKEA